jgi:hypothetical protein
MIGHRRNAVLRAVVLFWNAAAHPVSSLLVQASSSWTGSVRRGRPSSMEVGHRMINALAGREHRRVPFRKL